MDRLTFYIGDYVCPACSNCPKNGECKTDLDCISTLATRLAEYEDIGHTPSEILELLKEAEKLKSKTSGNLGSERYK